MPRVDFAQVPAYLQRQRWFAGKAAPIKGTNVLNHVELSLTGDDRVAALAVVEVTYERGAAERYLLAVRPGPDGELEDALGEKDFAHRLLRLVREAESVPAATGALRGIQVEGLLAPLADVSSSAQVRQLGGEQSNTSLVFEDRVILKVIRRLEPGRAPEWEIGRFLASRTSFRATPRLLGALELEGATAGTAALLHEFVPNQGDGWEYTLAAFREKSLSRDFLRDVAQLGGRVGELHAALASVADEPAFSPEPILLEDLQRWSASLIGELGVTLAMASTQFPELAELREGLVARAQRLAHLAPSGQKLRQHGDLHLGQVLRAADDWLIFDFEGEPARSLASRREKQSPLRDVAGMLRSFAYAAGVVGLTGAARDSALSAVRAAFLQGYREMAKRAGILPDTEEAFKGQLEAWELEKLLYELRYELQTRPDWAKIPVASLLQLGSD